MTGVQTCALPISKRYPKMISLCYPLSPLPPPPPHPGPLPVPADAADPWGQHSKRREPVLLQALTRSRGYSKPWPPAAGGAGAGPGAGDRRTWGRGTNANQLRNLMRRTCRSRFNQAERRGQPDRPKTGSDNQEDKYQDINGENRIKARIILDKNSEI